MIEPDTKPAASYKANATAYMREYMLSRYHRRRDRVIREMGGLCEWCGESDALEIDHRDPDDKAFHIAQRLASAPWRDLRAELHKCRLLCGPCHTIKTIEVDRGHTVRKPYLLAHKARLRKLAQLSLFPRPLVEVER